MDLTTALPTFVVTLREGFEAALVVGIVLACLQKAQQTHLNYWVYRGVGAGVMASIVVGYFLFSLVGSMESALVKEVLKVIFGLVAIAMLSWMLIWMTKQARSLKGEVQGLIDQALQQGSGKEIFVLVFIAVLREGFETVIFMAAKFQQDWLLPSLGALAGLIVAVILGLLIFKWGIKINLGLFFRLMGILLLLIVGGLVLGVFKHLDASALMLSQLSLGSRSFCLNWGDSCLLGPLVWDLREVLPAQQFPGILLKSLFGYRDQLYLVQAIAYLIFLVTVGSFYWQGTTLTHKSPPRSTVSDG